MKRPLLSALLLCMASGASGQGAPTAAQPFTLSLPRGIDPKTALINYVFRIGEGASGGTLGMGAGVFDYVIKPDADLGPPASLALRIYIPGYRMFTSEFAGEELQAGKTFVPQLVLLPTTTLKGRLIDAAGKALAGEHLNFDYVLAELLGPGGGLTSSLQIASTTTDGDGRFEIDVPSLLDDPFFANTGSPGFFEIRHGRGVRGMDFTLKPATLHVQKTYELLTIMKTRTGKLSGRLGVPFLTQNSLRESKDLQVQVTPSGGTSSTVTLGAMDMVARRPLDPRPTFNASVKPDGSFELQVPAGKYDVKLWVPEDDRSIQLEQGIVVEQDRHTEIGDWYVHIPANGPQGVISSPLPAD